MNIIFKICNNLGKQNYYKFAQLQQQIQFKIFTQDTPKNYKLNNYLNKCLAKNNIINLTKIQQLSLQTVLKGQNVVITSETGSGKTLCYLIPILNQILEQKQKFQQLSEEKEINIPINNIQTGAIILAPTKELCAQIYSMIRTIDINGKLNVSRTGSIAHLAPISDSKADFNKLKNVAFQNVVRGINWEETDILISTPTQLEQMLRIKDKKDPFSINPKTIVIDEVDLLLGDSTISRQTQDILKRFCFPNKIFNKDNLERQFILAGASLPKKIQKTHCIEILDEWFKKPAYIQSEDYHKIPPTIEFKNIDIEEYLDTNPEKSIFDILIDEIKLSKSKKIIVFCEKSKVTEQIVDYLFSKAGIKSAPFFATMSTEARMNCINEFHSGDFQVLVATDLASRGHCFEGVDHIIQFDFPTDVISFMHRVGRTGRLGQIGLVTNFIKEKDQFFYSKITQMLDNNHSIDTVFSRKRSLKKKNSGAFSDDENFY